MKTGVKLKKVILSVACGLIGLLSICPINTYANTTYMTREEKEATEVIEK